MKRAIGYARISDEDQSTWSLPGQLELITEYCSQNNIELVATFTDDGESAKNFDRADWKRLEEFVKKNHGQVDQLLVMAWTRFSRNTKEALTMIEQLENRYHIRVVSIREPLHMHPQSPFFHHIRTQMIQYGELELNFIKDRTKFGIHQAQKSGRYLNRAPRGYLNARNEKDEPIIIIDQTRAPLIRHIYDRFLIGDTIDSIRKQVKERGMNVKGNSMVQNILRNPVYMGCIKQIAYYDAPEAIVKGIHEPIIDENTWWKVQALFENKKSIHRSILNEDFPLRGVLKCFCNRNVTAAFSKGRNNLVGYYKCNSHTAINLNAKKLHLQFDEILKEISLPAFHIDYLQKKILENLTAKLRNREKEMQEKQQQLSALQKKIDSMEEKYILGDLDKEAYMKWKGRYHSETSLLQASLADLRRPVDQIWRNYKSSTSDLANLQFIYNKGSVQHKQSFVRMVFNNQLYYQEGVYRTPWIMPVFASKSAFLAEQRLLVIEQPPAETTNLAICAPSGSIIEPLFQLLNLFSEIKSKTA